MHKGKTKILQYQTIPVLVYFILFTKEQITFSPATFKYFVELNAEFNFESSSVSNVELNVKHLISNYI